LIRKIFEHWERIPQKEGLEKKCEPKFDRSLPKEGRVTKMSSYGVKYISWKPDQTGTYKIEAFNVQILGPISKA